MRITQWNKNLRPPKMAKTENLAVKMTWSQEIYEKLLKHGAKSIRPTCPRCHKGGYSQRQDSADQRPQFICGHCGNIWTCGKGGGRYAKLNPGE